MHRHTKHKHETDPVIPYWKRAHTDWRFILGVSICLMAIMIYVASDDLAWRPNLQLLSGALR